MSRTVISATGNVTVSSAHSGTDIYATGGQTTITLLASVPLADCDVRIINGDVGNGKLLVGFPSDVRQKLYPHQMVGVNSDGNVWFATDKPGRWLKQNAVIWVDGVAGLNGNDGLSSGTALKSIGAAGQVCQQDLDIQQTTPVIAVMAGTYSSDPLQLGGQPTGGNLIQISPIGGNVTMISNGPCITIGDNAEIDIRADYFGSSNSFTFMGNRTNTAANGHLYQHNNGLFDMSGTVIFSGAGLNDNAIFLDGPCPGASIANGFLLQGNFDTAFRMDEGGGRFTIGGTIGPVAGTAPFVNRLFAVLGTNQLIQSANLINGGYASLGPSVVGGNALYLNATGPTIPGGLSVTQGGRYTTTKW